MATKIRIYWQDIPVPLEYVKKYGYTIIAYEHIGIADCTIIEVKEDIKEMPKDWVRVDAFKFSRQK